MPTIDDVQVQSSIGFDGNSFTTAVSNDRLTNEDFLKLLLEEIRNQDPTKPADSQRLMDSQLRMSTIQANIEMSESLASLQQAYSNSALSNAANIIGKIVEDGQTGEDGLIKSYRVNNVETVDGELYLNVNQLAGSVDTIFDTENNQTLTYNSVGEILNPNGSETGVFIQLENGRFVLNENGQPTLLNSSGDVITDQDVTSKYAYGGEDLVFRQETNKILLSNVQKIWAEI